MQEDDKLSIIAHVQYGYSECTVKGCSKTKVLVSPSRTRR